MVSKSNEQTFQADIISQMIANGWLLGTPDGYNRELAIGAIRTIHGGQRMVLFQEWLYVVNRGEEL